MDKRRTLSRIIRTMLIILVLAFAYVLLRSLAGPSVTPQSNANFDSVQIGQTALRRVKRHRLWVTRLTTQHIRQFNELSDYVEKPSSGCNPSIPLCVIKAQASNGLDLVYSSAAPPQLSNDIPWYGGFIDPVSNGVFDLFGRAYKDVQSIDQRTALDLFKHD